MQRLLGANTTVNSYHHQAIRTVGKGLVATATAPDGIIEALEHETLPVFGVQWHPETFGTDDEALRERNLTVVEPVVIPDPAEVERQALATMVKKAIPGCETDANVVLPVGNPIFEHFLNLVTKGAQ